MKETFERKGKSKSRIAACFVVILLFSVVLVGSLSSCSLFSSEIVLKNLDIKVDIGMDGWTVFTETIEAKFTSQDSDWWNFYRIIDDPSLLARGANGEAFSINYASFSLDGRTIECAGPIDLELSDAKSKYTRLYSDQAVGYYYARPGEGVEIGVIMPEFSSGTHKISYSYSIKGIVTEIADASVFYYQYVSEINTMDIEKMSVTVNFPKEEDPYSWLHVSKSALGVWTLSDDHRSISVQMEDVSAGEYVESRMLLTKGAYGATEKDTSLTSIDVQNEEQAWYDAYTREQNLRLAVTILDYILAVAAVVFGVFYLIRLKKKNAPLELPNAPIYYREIPEGYTGGEVSPLYFYYSNENYIDESISATMLELVRLGYITIAPDEKKKNALITVLKKDEEDALRTHQKLVVEMLLAVKPMGTSFTMKEFEKYGKEHSEKMLKLVESYKAAIRNKSQRDGDYRKGNPAREKAQSFSIKMVGAGVAVVVLSGFASFLVSAGMFFFGAGLIIGGMIPYLFSKKVKAPLTLTGQKEYDKLHALAKFMQEFSAMDEHEIPELVLWEDYMIFATAMGIADKVAEQLEIAYPEFKAMSARGFDPSGFMILYFFSRSFRVMTGLNFIGNVANVIRSVEIAQRAIKAAQLAGKVGGIIGGGSGRGGGSSFHGGGGGFHGGGFGGRR